jgi:hypothetical protein
LGFTLRKAEQRAYSGSGTLMFNFPLSKGVHSINQVKKTKSRKDGLFKKILFFQWKSFLSQEVFSFYQEINFVELKKFFSASSEIALLKDFMANNEPYERSMSEDSRRGRTFTI